MGTMQLARLVTNIPIPRLNMLLNSVGKKELDVLLMQNVVILTSYLVVYDILNRVSHSLFSRETMTRQIL